MAAVAAPKICRERERKGREGRKEREKRRKKTERRKRKEMARRAREKDVGLLRLYRCKTPPENCQKIVKDTKRGGLKKVKKQKGRGDRKGRRKNGDMTDDRLRCENIGSVFYSSIKPYLS